MSYYGKPNPFWPHDPVHPKPPKPPLPPKPDPVPCPHEPGTVLRIYIPAGAEINLANLLEVSAPDGICLLVRIPLLAGDNPTQSLGLDKIFENIIQSGGSIEVL